MFAETSFSASEMSFPILAEMSFGRNAQKKSLNMHLRILYFKTWMCLVSDGHGEWGNSHQWDPLTKGGDQYADQSGHDPGLHPNHRQEEWHDLELGTPSWDHLGG